jgi:hypothetical protein
MKQTITIEAEFEVEHIPDKEKHLQVVLESYLQSKGVVIRDGRIIV